MAEKRVLGRRVKPAPIWLAGLWGVGGTGLAGLAWAAVAVVAVTVPPEVTVTGPRTLLGEVAFIEALDPTGRDLAEALGRVDLGAAPAPGRTVVLRRDQLKKTLLATGLDLKSAAWTLPPELKVTAGGAPVTSADLRAALEKYLAASEPYRSGRFEILSLNPAALPDLPPGGLTCRFQPQMSSNPVYVSGHFIFSQDGRDVGRLKATAQVDLSVPALVAVRALPRGRALTEADLSLTLVPFHQARGALTDPALAVGAALKTPLAAGDILRDRALARSLMVKRGDPVAILAQQGNLSVSAAGEARADGALGDVITVTNLGSQKNVRARVIGPHRVEVVF